MPALLDSNEAKTDAEWELAKKLAHAVILILLHFNGSRERDMFVPKNDDERNVKRVASPNIINETLSELMCELWEENDE